METLKDYQQGKFQIKVTSQDDYDADTSWIGEYCNFDSKHTPHTNQQKLVHRASKLVLDHNGIWRDAKGHIQHHEERLHSGRDYEYTFHDNGHERIEYALRDSEYLDDINNGNKGFMGISVKVYLKGVEIAHASLWGIETDAGDAHIKETIEDLTSEAIREANAWLEQAKSA